MGVAGGVMDVGYQVGACVYCVAVGLDYGVFLGDVLHAGRVPGAVKASYYGNGAVLGVVGEEACQGYSGAVYFYFLDGLSGEGVKISVAAYQKICYAVLYDVACYLGFESRKYTLAGVAVSYEKTGTHGTYLLNNRVFAA